jgi:hypothetical protein
MEFSKAESAEELRKRSTNSTPFGYFGNNPNIKPTIDPKLAASILPGDDSDESLDSNSSGDED